MSNSPPLIFQQIPKVMAELEAIGKDQKNAQQGFMFRGIDDVYNELHPRLAAHKLFTVTEVIDERREERETRNGGKTTHVILKVKFTMYAEDGSSISSVLIGEGADSGDKASNKAQAIAHKYFFLQTFCIPTKESNDPDAESHEFKANAAKKTDGPKPKTQPATGPKPKASAPQQRNPLKDARSNDKLLEENPGEYVVPFGGFSKMKLKDIPSAELTKYIHHIQTKALEDGKEIKGQVAEFMTYACAYQSMNGEEMEDQGPPLSDLPNHAPGAGGKR